MKKRTRVNHQPATIIQKNNNSLTPVIYPSVKYTFDSYQDLLNLVSGKIPGHTYSRVSNPTREQLEILLAELQDTEAGLATANGVAAISTCLFALLKAGDHVIMFKESYKPTRYIIRDLLGKFGVEHSLLSIHDHQGITAAIKKNTKLMIFESPTNPVLHIADINKLIKIAKENKILTVMDNTFAGIHQHGNFKIDIFLHSLTKYAAGHSDVMGGAILGSKKIIEIIKPVMYEFGTALDPFSCFQVSRGLKTYFIRFEQSTKTALQLAKWLETQAQVKNLKYPGLASHPQAKLATEQMQDFGPLLVFDLDTKESNLGKFFDSLKLFKLAFGLGTTESTIVPVKRFYCSDLSSEDNSLSGITDTTLRISVGLEDYEDLKTDLEQAFQVTYR